MSFIIRKFNIDETVSFKGSRIEHPTYKEELNVLVEIGHFFITNQRIIFIGDKGTMVKFVDLDDITSADFDGMSYITYHTKTEGDLLFKYDDASAEVLYIFFNRIKKGDFKI